MEQLSSYEKTSRTQNTIRSTQNWSNDERSGEDVSITTAALSTDW